MNKKEVSKNYYTNTKRKIVDFLIGFIGFLVIYRESMILVSSNYHPNTVIPFVFFIKTLLVVFVILLFLSLISKRRFIAFGIFLCFFSLSIYLVTIIIINNK